MRPSPTLAAVFLALGPTLGGCSSSSASPSETDGGSDASDLTGKPCTSDTACGAAFACFYRVADGCQAAGMCRSATASGGTHPPACPCDGTFTTDLNGYARKPVLHMGQCRDGEANSDDAQTDAVSGD